MDPERITGGPLPPDAQTLTAFGLAGTEPVAIPYGEQRSGLALDEIPRGGVAPNEATPYRHLANVTPLSKVPLVAKSAPERVTVQLPA